MIESVQKWSRFIIGLFVVSIGVVLTIKAELGVAPWDVFHIGLTKYFNLTVGRAGQLTGIGIILISFIVARIKPTIGTIINILVVGFMIDWMMGLLPQPSLLIYRYIYLIIGTIIFGIGVGIYISSQCGTGPRDSLMMALNHKLKFSIGKIRNSMELTALSCGYLLGGPVGIGTIFIALGVGPIVEKSLKIMNKLFNNFSLQGDAW